MNRSAWLSATLSGLLLLLSQQATATIITFNNWTHASGSDPADYTVTVDDNTAGFLTFNIAVNTSTLPDADLFGFFFDGGNSWDASSAIVSGSNVTGVYYNTLRCGAGCNVNGLTTDPFDVGVRFLDSGSSSGNLLSTSFTVAALGLSISDIGRTGIRAQSSGASGNGSDKALSVSVPEPASVALIGTGLMLLGFSRKFSRSK